MAESNHLEHNMAQSSRGIFDFFGLPRELRNEIYSMLTHVKTLCRGRNAEGVATQFEASIKSAPIPKAFSLCRQFKTEYEEAFEDGMTLVIRDLWSGMKTPSTAGWLDNITRAQILLLLGCKHGCNYDGVCRIYADLKDHLEWIKDILPQLKELKALEVRYSLVRGSDKITSQLILLLIKLEEWWRYQRHLLLKSTRTSPW
jgi:hypothetical protein